MPLRRYFFRSILFLFGTLLCVGCGESARSHPKMAQDFTLPLYKNSSQKIRLQEVVSQQPVLLVFWATWCPSCQQEMPILNRWKTKYPNLKILAINVEQEDEEISNFEQKKAIHFPVLLDRDGEVSRRYEIETLPSIILLAKGGGILYYGFTLPQNLEQLLAKELLHGSE